MTQTQVQEIADLTNSALDGVNDKVSQLEAEMNIAQNMLALSAGSAAERKSMLEKGKNGEEGGISLDAYG